MPTLNDDLVQKISHGMVKLKPAVTKVDESAVYFKDGTRLEVDAIVLATGYEPSLPFLSDEFLPWKGDGLATLYKHIFPTKPMHEGLCFVGISNLIAPFYIISELQARCAAAVLSGTLSSMQYATFLVQANAIQQ